MSSRNGERGPYLPNLIDKEISVTCKNAHWVCGAMMMIALQGCNGCSGCSGCTGSCPAGQSKERDSSTGVGNDYAINSSLAQSFSPAVDYKLVTVDLLLTAECKDQTISLGLYDSCGNPAPITSGSRQGLAGWTTFAMPETSVISGHLYCIKPIGKGLPDACKWSLGTDNTYGRGDAWQSGYQILIAGRQADFAFRVHSQTCMPP